MIVMGIISTQDTIVSARIDKTEKDKLKTTGYNARQAIEYFNSLFADEIESLRIQKFFLMEEIIKQNEKLLILKHQLEELNRLEERYEKGV